jgi:hypothetical protein
MLIFSGISLQPSFQLIAVNYLKKIKNFSFVSIFLQYHSLPDNIDLARYLIEECQAVKGDSQDEVGNNKKDREKSFQYGLDILIRLKKYDEVFIALINKGMLSEALIFLKKYKINVNLLSDENVKKMTSLIKKNKHLVLDYLIS